MQIRWIISGILSLVLLAGCSSAPMQPSSTVSSVDRSQLVSTSIKATLYQQHREWVGTRYELGGLTKQGVDCSGLVYRTYLDKFGTPIPRTTQYQVKSGTQIAKKQLSAGDLVFFKTENKGLHVGIYIEDGQFLHASSSRGVMISRLTDYYWKDRYWQARRISL